MCVIYVLYMSMDMNIMPTNIYHMCNSYGLYNTDDFTAHVHMYAYIYIMVITNYDHFNHKHSEYLSHHQIHKSNLHL
jgi:hypothetical protein